MTQHMSEQELTQYVEDEVIRLLNSRDLNTTYENVRAITLEALKPFIDQGVVKITYKDNNDFDVDFVH